MSENDVMNWFDTFKTLDTSQKHRLMQSFQDEERAQLLRKQFTLMEQAMPNISPRTYLKAEFDLMKSDAVPLVLVILNECYQQSEQNNVDDFLCRFIEEQKNVYRAKNADYGDAFVDSIKKYGLISYFVRANDKINRIEQLSKNGYKAKVAEQLDDSYRDLFNYTIMFLSEMEALIF